MLLFVSCGQQQQAKEIIQDFDSTRVINDSIILAMRANADTIKRYVKLVKYAEGSFGGKLYVARITYTIDGAEYSDTYYLDDQLSRVVAFKSN